MNHLYESKARDFKLARTADTLSHIHKLLASCEGAVISILLLKAETLLPLVTKRLLEFKNGGF